MNSYLFFSCSNIDIYINLSQSVSLGHACVGRSILLISIVCYFHNNQTIMLAIWRQRGLMKDNVTYLDGNKDIVFENKFFWDRLVIGLIIFRVLMIFNSFGELILLIWGEKKIDFSVHDKILDSLKWRGLKILFYYYKNPKRSNIETIFDKKRQKNHQHQIH